MNFVLATQRAPSGNRILDFMLVAALGDTTPPTFDGVLAATATTRWVTLNWLGTVADDDRGFVRHEYRIDSGAWIAATASEEVSSSHVFKGLTPDTLYLGEMRVCDGAGNYSAPLSVTIATLALHFDALQAPSSRTLKVDANTRTVVA
jgi:hypothetical protein